MNSEKGGIAIDFTNGMYYIGEKKNSIVFLFFLFSSSIFAQKEILAMNAFNGCEAISRTGGSVRIRADATAGALAASELLQRDAPVLAEAARFVADPGCTVSQELLAPAGCAWGEDGASPACAAGCEALRRGRQTSVYGGVRVAAPACQRACPAGIRIASALEQLRLGNPDGAAQIVMQSNPIPALTGRLCDHACETACCREEGVAVHAVECAIGDYALAHASNLYVPAPDSCGKRAAVLGSGAAGLTAAFYLRQNGCDVTVFAMQGSPLAAFEGRVTAETLQRLLAAYTGMGVVFMGAYAPEKAAGFDFVYDSAADEDDSVIESVRRGRGAAHGLLAAHGVEEGHLCVGKQIHLPFLTFDAEGVSRASGLCGEAADLPHAVGEAQRCMNCGCYAAAPSVLAPALLALDAVIHTSERSVKAADLLEKPRLSRALRKNERIVEIEVPVIEGAAMRFDAVRPDPDGSLVCLASVFGVMNGQILRSRLILGGAAPVPLRLNEAEAALAFSEISEETAESAAAFAVKSAVPGRYAEKTLHAIRTMLREAVLSQR